MKKHLFLKSLLVAIGLLIASINTVWAKRVYVQPNQWNNDSHYVSVYAFGSSTLAARFYYTSSYDATNGIYVADIDDSYTTIILVRQKPGKEAGFDNDKMERQTGNITLENSSNYNFHNCWSFNNNWTGSGNTFDNKYYWEKDAYVYVDISELDMTYGNWGSNVYMRIGKSDHCEAWTVKSDPNKVPNTASLYKMTGGKGYLGYTRIYITNAAGQTGTGKNIYQTGTGITQQTLQIENSSNTEAYTIIPRKTNAYAGDDGIYYYQREEYNYKKTYTITNTVVDNAEVVLYYWDENNVMQTVAEGSSAQVLPTTYVWCRVRPEAGYSVPKVMLTDGGAEREWTDASREDGDFERNRYIVRHDVSFRAVVERYATKTVLIEDVENFAPNIYFKGWNPFLYAEYDNREYQVTTLKLTDKVHICGKDYYVVTFTNEFPFFYIHNENQASQTKFFTYSSLTHMAKYSDAIAGDGNWGLHPEDCGDAIYWVEVTDGSGDHYISNVVASTNDTLSFYVGEGSTVDFHAGGSSPVDQYDSKFKSYFNEGQALYRKAGAVFTAKTDGSGLTEVAIFDGDYHIHVNAKTRNYLNAGGVSKPETTGTKFIPFEKSSLFNDTYDHYWVDWFLGSGDAGGYKEQSVVATVGNKYNSNLAGILGSDNFAPKGMTKAAGGNVRYGYDPETNHFERAIVASGDAAVQIQSNTAVTDNDSVMVSSDGGSTYTNNAITARYFADATNWNYQVYAKVRGGSHATAKTSYVSGTQILANQKQLIGGSGSEQYVVVITYDFKTNRFIAAWKPAGDFEGFDLESNLMIIRTEDGNPTVLNIVDKNDDGKVTPLTKITKMYTVLELLQDNWASDEATYSDNPYAKRRIISGDYIDEYYWISLPYECLVKDIFGIEDYGSNGSWVLQTYRGDLRAEKGWWAETNAWWYDMDRSDTLKAHEGYVLRVTNLNEDYRAPGISKKFKGDSGGKLSLYFPSEDNELTIAPLTGTVTTHLDSLKCTKWHKRSKDVDPTEGENNPIYDRRAIDSNWRIIGSPSFNSTTISAPEFILTSADKNKDGYITYAEYQEFVTKYIEDHDGATPYSLKYFYNWEVDYKGAGVYETKFTIANASTTEFKGTHAHLVQYAGDITWVAYDGSNPLVGITNKVVARQQETETGEQTLRLVLKQGASDADVAYISRMEFGATTGYDLNMDLSKMINANSANIYTMGELYKMAGNCIPDTVTTLPVGVQLAADGNYTFAMPDGTYGTGVVLIDKIAGTRTNLTLTDYTVNLTAGTYDDRFELELSPIANTPTDIQTISDERLEISGARKVMVDGVLYIVKDGVVFDAQGNRVK